MLLNQKNEIAAAVCCYSMQSLVTNVIEILTWLLNLRDYESCHHPTLDLHELFNSF